MSQRHECDIESKRADGDPMVSRTPKRKLVHGAMRPAATLRLPPRHVAGRGHTPAISFHP
jgi:hypothetical protein